MKRLTTLILIVLVSTLNAQSQNKLDMQTNNYSTEIIRYKVSADHHDEFLKAYTQAGKYLQASKFCLGYEITQGDEEPDNFIITIFWTSKDDHMNGFRKSAEFGPFFNLVRPFYNNIEEMKHYISKATWKNEL